MDYISVTVEVDAATIKDEQIALLQDRIPGLEVRDGHILNFTLEADAEQHAENRQLLSEVFDTIYEAVGEHMFRTPIREATFATSTATVTAIDTDGHTLPAGTSLTLAGLDGDRVAFETTNTVTIPAASDTTGVGEVLIVAVEAGTAGTGLQADPQLEDALSWIDTIVVEDPTAGGEDGEDRDEYRNRLTDSSPLKAVTLVLAEDYARDARNNVEGVERALALDLYNPDDDTYGNAGYEAVAVIDEAGEDPGSEVRAIGEARQQELSVAEMTVNWIAATVTDVDVDFAAKCYVEFDPDDVETRAIAAVTAYLTGLNWGLPPFGDRREWIDRPIVRYRDVVAVVENVEGLDYTTSLTVDGGTSNVTLTGPAALPNPGAITGAVTLP